VYDSAKLRIAYPYYKISEVILVGVILQLRYENDIPMINRNSRVVVVGDIWYNAARA
jgi:hypothetical protein